MLGVYEGKIFWQLLHNTAKATTYAVDNLSIHRGSCHSWHKREGQQSFESFQSLFGRSGLCQA